MPRPVGRRGGVICRRCGYEIDCQEELRRLKTLLDVPVSCGASGPDRDGGNVHGELWQCVIAASVEREVTQSERSDVHLDQPRGLIHAADQLVIMALQPGRADWSVETLQEVADWLRRLAARRS